MASSGAKHTDTSADAEAVGTAAFSTHTLITKPGRHPWHTTIASINVLQAATFAALTTEGILRGHSRLYFAYAHDEAWRNCLTLVLEALLLVTQHQVAEYYWHRFQHLPMFYKHFHKMHHHYKSPNCYDDMFIHPLEAFGYYVILWSPPFLFHTHLHAFLIYIAVMGVCGILDHSGIRFHLPGVYNTADHDDHHKRFDVNYAFPFPYMDLLHGTYRGTFLGFTFYGRGPPSWRGSVEPTTGGSSVAQRCEGESPSSASGSSANSARGQGESVLDNHSPSTSTHVSERRGGRNKAAGNADAGSITRTRRPRSITRATSRPRSRA